jgi:hypothetical protein
MPTWNGEIQCPRCGTWQIPSNLCPHCGYTWLKNERFALPIDAHVQKQAESLPGNCLRCRGGLFIQVTESPYNLSIYIKCAKHHDVSDNKFSRCSGFQLWETHLSIYRCPLGLKPTAAALPEPPSSPLELFKGLQIIGEELLPGFQFCPMGSPVWNQRLQILVQRLEALGLPVKYENLTEWRPK